jgi:GTP cyclohydrolase II
MEGYSIMDTQKSSHIILTSHVDQIPDALFPIHWGDPDPQKRAPIIATLTNLAARNAIGAHGGSYAVYRALGIASGHFPKHHKPDLTHTSALIKIGPCAAWEQPDKIVSLDPWGANITEYFQQELAEGYDIHPTIAITNGHLRIPEIEQAIQTGRLQVDHRILTQTMDVCATKIAIEPVWYLPGIAKRFSINEALLRETLFEKTGGMFPELVTRPDLKILLPPIGGSTVYIFGNPQDLANPKISLTCRVHDECNGSDVFGSDLCTCRPYLTHGIEEAIKTAQEGGVGLIVYFRKEGRALGEVTKFLVYNARKQQQGGDRANMYFYRTECVAGVQDARFQELMPDVLHWLGITKIDKLVSMSDMKYKAITESGIEVSKRISIPAHLIPSDAQVEIQAKKAAGYYIPEGEEAPTQEHLLKTKGRSSND